MNRRVFCPKGLFVQVKSIEIQGENTAKESQGQMPNVSSSQSHGDRGWSIHYLVSNVQTNHLSFPALSILSLATAWRYKE